MKDSDGREELRQEAAIPAIVLQTRVYTMIMEVGCAAMPGGTVGLLVGRTSHVERAGAESAEKGIPGGASGLQTLRAPWVRIEEAVGMRNVQAGDLRQVLEDREAGATDLQIVGWFYADPGIGVFPPTVPLRDMQDDLPESAGIFLLVNPCADQGAFYVWDGEHYLPTGGFYEIVPNGNVSPVIRWNGEVNGAESWFGPLLAEIPPTRACPEPAKEGSVVLAESELPAEDERETSADDGSGLPAEAESPGSEHPAAGEELLLGADEPDQEGSRPIFVEVITEEPVEYVAPERPADTLDLIPGPELFPEQSEEDAESSPSPPDRPIPRPSGTTAPLEVPEPGGQKTDVSLPENTTPGQPGDISTGSSAQDGEHEPEAEQQESGAGADSVPATEQRAASANPTGTGETYSAPVLMRSTPPATLVPVKRSIVQPVVKGRSTREALMTLGSLLGIIALLVFLLGKPQRPDDTGQGNALISEPTATRVQIEVSSPDQNRALPGYLTPSPVPTQTTVTRATPAPQPGGIDATDATATKSPPAEGAP